MAKYEIIRKLTRFVPVMVNAKWVVPTSKRILTFSLCFLVIILLQSSVHAEKNEEKNKR